MASPARPLAEGIELGVKVTPRAARTELAGLETDAAGQRWLQLRLAAPPVEGAANAALLRFLAGLLEVAPSACRVVAGATARRKRVRIAGDPRALEARLAQRLAATGR